MTDTLLSLSMIFGVPSAMGRGLGCAVANVYGGFGMVDVVGGAMGNIIAGTLAWYVAKQGGGLHRFFGTAVETVVIIAIVGGYLVVIFKVPSEVGLLNELVGVDHCHKHFRFRSRGSDASKRHYQGVESIC